MRGSLRPALPVILPVLLLGVVGCPGGGGGGQPPAIPGGINLAGTLAGLNGAGNGAQVPGPASTLPTQNPPPLPANPVSSPSGAAPAAPSSSASNLVPPAGGSSNGTGGQAGLSGAPQSTNGANYYLFVPANYSGAPTPMLLVFTGVEGAVQQSLGGLVSPLPAETQFLPFWIPQVGLDNFIICIIDTPAYSLQGVKDEALAPVGAIAMDDVRAHYNIDNDRTCLLGESMGTRAGEQMGFHLRQSYFAAYYLNDVVHIDAPAQTAAQLGFAPSSQVGPGGAYNTANALVTNLRTAGYRLPAVAPYNGAGSNLHGSPDQLMEAYRFFAGKSRQ